LPDLAKPIVAAVENHKSPHKPLTSSVLTIYLRCSSNLNLGLLQTCKSLCVMLLRNRMQWRRWNGKT